MSLLGAILQQRGIDHSFLCEQVKRSTYQVLSLADEV